MCKILHNKSKLINVLLPNEWDLLISKWKKVEEIKNGSKRSLYNIRVNEDWIPKLSQFLPTTSKLNHF